MESRNKRRTISFKPSRTSIKLELEASQQKRSNVEKDLKRQDEWKRRNPVDGEVSEVSSVFSIEEKLEKARLESMPKYVPPLRRTDARSTNKYVARRVRIEAIKKVKEQLTYTSRLDQAFANTKRITEQQLDYLTKEIESNPQNFNSDFRSLRNYISEPKEKRKKIDVLDDFELTFYEDQINAQQEYDDHLQDIIKKCNIKIKNPKKVSLPFKESINLKSQDPHFYIEYMKKRSKIL